MNTLLKIAAKTGFALVFGIACFWVFVGANTGAYEVTKTRKASNVLPKDMLEGKHYKINETVLVEGYMHIYTVTSDFGTFTARSDTMLRRLLREIAAIAILKKQSTLKTFGESVAKSATDPLEGARDLVSKPVKTLSNIPRGIHRLLESGVKSFERERTVYEDSDFAALMAVSSYKRDYAAEYGVDVYSSNDTLQEELDRVAWASVPGYMTVSLALTPAKGSLGVAVKRMGAVYFSIHF